MLPIAFPTFFHLLFLLVAFHFILDFAIQGDFVAKFKARHIEGHYNSMWKWVLTAHAAAHAIPVLLFTGSIYLMLFMFISHFVIDYLKCEGKFGFDIDQISHLFVILLISAITYFML